MIKQFFSKKSSGPNSPTDLQLLNYDISKPTQIFNLSFRTGNYPDMLKTAKIIPNLIKGFKLFGQ